MKKIKLIIMSLLILQLSFNSCTPGKIKLKEEIKPLLISEALNKNNVKIYTFTVNAKDWQTLSSNEIYIDVFLDVITEKIISKGLVMIYLTQKDKYLALPFNYYQVRRILSFQPSYQPGHAYINIFGNFLININEYYTFDLLVISPETLNKCECVNWQNYNEVKKALEIKY